MQMNGYKRIRSCATNTLNKSLCPTLITALDNELQHHKMYKEFIKMGFSKESFYTEIDNKKYLDDCLNLKPNDFEHLLVDYLTVIAPGGCLSATEVKEFKIRFRKKINDASKFQQLDDIISSWIKCDHYDHENFVKQIFHLIANPQDTWVGYDNGYEFPQSGFFIDRKFTPKI